MKKIDLIKVGLFPIAVSTFFYMISYFSQNKMLFSFMSIAFILIWSYIAYQIGKISNNIFRDIIFSNLIPIIFVIIQILVIIYSTVINNYFPALVSQLYFLPISKLITSLFSFNEEIIVISSFLLMLSVFSLGFFKGKLNA